MRGGGGPGMPRARPPATLRGPTLRQRQRLTLRAVGAGPGRDQVVLGVAEGVLAGVAGALRARGEAAQWKGGEGREASAWQRRRTLVKTQRAASVAPPRRAPAALPAPPRRAAPHQPDPDSDRSLVRGRWAGGRRWAGRGRHSRRERQRGAPSPTRRLARLTLSLPLQVPWPEQELLQPAKAVAARRSTQAMMRMVSSGELEWEGRGRHAPRRTTPLGGLCRPAPSRATRRVRAVARRPGRHAGSVLRGLWREWGGGSSRAGRARAGGARGRSYSGRTE